MALIFVGQLEVLTNVLCVIKVRLCALCDFVKQLKKSFFKSIIVHHQVLSARLAQKNYLGLFRFIPAYLAYFSFPSIFTIPRTSQKKVNKPKKAYKIK